MRIPLEQISAGDSSLFLRIRPALPEDEPFLLEVYASHRKEELAAMP